MSRFGTTIAGAPLLWLRRALLLGLTALAAWLAVRLVLALVEPSSRFQPVLVAAGPASVQSAARVFDFSYDPFNTAQDVEVVVEVPDPGEDAPETTLNLELKGLRAGDNGSAFIRTPNGDEDNYYVGEEIMPSVVLRGVFPDFVLLDVNGQRQRLTTAEAKAARAASRGGRVDRPSGLQTLRAPDAATLLSQVQLTPQLDEGMNRIGVRLNSRSAGVDLEAYGLRENDVVTRFAGQSLTSGLPDIASLRRAVTPGRPVAVDILRDGQPMTITIGSSQ
ncbi:MAG: type II secretion system protein N [Litorimonas sp.]